MILYILQSLFRGLHIPLAYLIQITMDQCRIPIQEPSHSSEHIKKPFPLLQVDPIQLQQLLPCKCANTTKCTPPCECVLAFSQIFFKGLVTQFTTPLDSSNDAKLDHSSGTRWPICKKVCLLDSTTIYPKTGHALLYTTFDRWDQMTYKYTFALRILFHLLRYWCNTCTNHITNDMIHSISSHDLVG